MGGSSGVLPTRAGRGSIASRVAENRARSVPIWRGQVAAGVRLGPTVVDVRAEDRADGLDPDPLDQAVVEIETLDAGVPGRDRQEGSRRGEVGAMHVPADHPTGDARQLVQAAGR